MRCKSAERLLPEYIEGTLSSKQLDQLEHHLDDCPHCPKAKRTLEKTIRLASSLPVAYPSPAVWENFWPQLRMRIKHQASAETGHLPFWIRRNGRKLASGACLLAFLAIVWSFSSLGLFRTPATHHTPTLDQLILQNFTSEIPVDGLREQLNQELRRLNWSSNPVDELHWQTALSPDSAGELSTSRELLDQFFQAIATELEFKYFEEESFTDLVFSENGELASLE